MSLNYRPPPTTADYEAYEMDQPYDSGSASQGREYIVGNAPLQDRSSSSQPSQYNYDSSSPYHHHHQQQQQQQNPTPQYPIDTGEYDPESTSPPPADTTTTTSPAPSPPPTSYPSPPKLAAILLGTSLIFFAVLLDQSILSTAIPEISSDFRSLPDVGWYTGAYQLTSATLQPLSGKLYAYLPMKWTFMAYFLLFEVGSLLCALATSSSFFIAGRAVAGIGVSGLSNGALSVVAASVPLEKRAFYLGLLIGIGQLGLVSGPLIGGAFTENVSWRWCFWINLPLGGLAGGSLLVTDIPEIMAKEKISWELVRRKVVPQFDLVGLGLFAPAAVMLLLALQFGSGGTIPWDSSVIIGLFVGAGVAAVIFIFWERRVGDIGIMPANLVGQRVVYSSCLQYSFLLGAIMLGTQYFPMYFQSVKGVGPTLSGVYLLPSICSQLLFVLVSGALVSKVGYYLPFATIAGVGALIGSALIAQWQPGTPTGEWVGYQILYGLRGMGIQIAVVAVQNHLPPKDIAVGTAFLVFCQTFTAAVFVVVGNTIYTQSLVKEITRLVPEVNTAKALATGGSAEAVRSLLPEGSPKLQDLLTAYSNSFDLVCYFMFALAVLSVFASLGMGWVDVRKKPEEDGKKDANQISTE